MSKRNIGVFNPNWKGGHRRDSIDYTGQLSERELLVIKIKTSKTVIRSYEGFIEKMTQELEELEKALREIDEQAALAHIDRLAGEERATIKQMDDVQDLLTKEAIMAELPAGHGTVVSSAVFRGTEIFWMSDKKYIFKYNDEWLEADSLTKVTDFLKQNIKIEAGN